MSKREIFQRRPALWLPATLGFLQFCAQRVRPRSRDVEGSQSGLLGQRERSALRLTAGEAERAGATNFNGTGAGDVDVEFGHPALFPRDPYGQTPSGPEASNSTFWPRRRQGGQKVEGTGVALQQHFTDGGRSPKIRIYLEHTRVVGAEEVVGKGALEDPQALPGELPLRQPRP